MESAVAEWQQRVDAVTAMFNELDILYELSQYWIVLPPQRLQEFRHAFALQIGQLRTEERIQRLFHMSQWDLSVHSLTLWRDSMYELELSVRQLQQSTTPNF